MEQERREHGPRPEAELQVGVSFGAYPPYLRGFLENFEIAGWHVETKHGNLLTADGILQRTGVEKRYVADEYETTYFMGTVAAIHALGDRSNGVPVDYIFVTTTYPTGINMANEMSIELKLNAPGQDVFAACSGFSFVLSYIKDNEREFMGKEILIVSTEKHQDKVHDLRNGGAVPLDGTIFADGAEAARFRYGEDLTVLAAINKMLGLPELLKVPINRSLRIDPYLEFPEGGVPFPVSGKIEQDGTAVFKLVTKAVPPLVKKVVQMANLRPEDIKAVIPHQASIHVLDSFQRQLAEYGSLIVDIRDGNYSSASIPKAMRKAVRGELDVRLEKGDIVVLVGFGAGIVASACVVQL